MSQASFSNDYTQIFPKNENQKRLLEDLRDPNTPIVIASGYAGTGKSLLAVFAAVEALKKGHIDQLVVVRPQVKIGQLMGLGFVPGTLKEKSEPLLGAVIDNLQVFCSPGLSKYILDKNQIEALSPEYLRGRSFNKTWLLIDEAQNCSPSFLKLCLTRLGQDSKVIFTGDTTQLDTKDNGLKDAIDRLYDVDGIGITQFDVEDVVRHGILKRVLNRYLDVV